MTNKTIDALKKNTMCRFIYRNLLSVPVRYYKKYKNQRIICDRLNVNRIIDNDCAVVALEEKKTKVRLFFSAGHLWSVIEPIITVFSSDTAYELLCLILPGFDMEFREELCLKYGVPYVVTGGEDVAISGEYNIEKDNPDIMIFFEPFSLSRIKKNELKKIRMCSQFLIYISTNLTLNGYDVQMAGDVMKTALDIHFDCYLYDLLLYERIKNNALFEGIEVFPMGNVKYDYIFHAIMDRKDVLQWRKLKGKKILLYAPDHDIYDYVAAYSCTFDLYAEKIFNWAAKHKEIGLIFRPHPALINELLKQEIWTKKDIFRLREYFSNTSNIVWDFHETYGEAYSYCDAVLTDAFCGVACSSLPLGNPIGVLYRSDGLGNIPFREELNEYLFEIRNELELVDFLDDFLAGIDRYKEKRELAQKKYIKHFDGKNAERLKIFVDQKWLEKSRLNE